MVELCHGTKSNGLCRKKTMCMKNAVILVGTAKVPYCAEHAGRFPLNVPRTELNYRAPVSIDPASPLFRRLLNRHPWRACPVCSMQFSLAGDVTEHAWDTCQPRCAIALERFGQERELSAAQAVVEYRNNFTKGG